MPKSGKKTTLQKMSNLIICTKCGHNIKFRCEKIGLKLMKLHNDKNHPENQSPTINKEKIYGIEKINGQKEYSNVRNIK